MGVYRSAGTKTTFILSDSRRARLKAVAIARRTTVTELLAEGADLVLEKYERMADMALLAMRARKAKEKLRRGLYRGSTPAVSADEVVYGTHARRERRRSSLPP
jgi:hypothetical protein